MSVIKIKRSGSTGSPSSLGQGEMAYSYLTGSEGNGGDRLYIGTGTEIGGNAANIEVIGGKYFTEKLNHTPGTVTANSALIVDDDSKLNKLFVDNLSVDGNEIRSVNTDGDILIGANGSGVVNVDNSRITNVSTPSSNTDAANKLYVDNYFIDGFLTLFDISGDSGSDDGIKYHQTLAFTGGTGVNTAISNNEVTFTIGQDVATTANVTFANITVSGNVDGRDVSADGSKLDTIETNADVTDANNVQAAGALMDSELTDASSVKAIDQGLSTADSPSFTGVLNIDGNAPRVELFEADSNTAARVMVAAGKLYLQAGTEGEGKSASNGDIRFTGWEGNDVELFQIKSNGYQDILHDGLLTSPSDVKAIDQSLTTTANVTFANITVSGNVDGRDISSDGTKLDTIETNADVTDANNVQAAGALMDSELTDITSVKAIDQGLSTADSPTFNNVLYVEGIAPRTELLEADSNTAARFFTTAGKIYIQAGASGSGKTTSSGDIRFTGWEGNNVNEFQIRYGGSYRDIWHDGLLTSPSDVKAIDQGLSTSDSPTFANMSIEGDLTVKGNTTFVDVSTLNVEDSLIMLASNNTADTVDIGWVGQYDSTGTKFAGLIRNSSDGNFYVFKDYSGTVTNNEIDVSHPSFTLGQLHISDLVVSGNVDGRDISSDGSKLDTIETNADVTDANNVQAAGALMDSELTDEASVKAINQGLSTSDSPTFNNIVYINGVAGRTEYLETDSNTAARVMVAAGKLYLQAGTEGEGKSASNGDIRFTGWEGNDVELFQIKSNGYQDILHDGLLTSPSDVKAIDQGLSTSDSPTFSGLTVDTNTLVVDEANSNVGIGVSNPLEKLHIGNGDAIRLDGSSSGYNKILAKYATGGIVIESSRGSGNTTYVDFEAPDINSSSGRVLYRFGRETTENTAENSELVMYAHDNSATASISLSSNGDITMLGDLTAVNIYGDLDGGTY